MRQKIPYIVISFDTTDDALALESAAKTEGIPGRVIPLPSEVSAGCGMAWAVPVEESETVVEEIKRIGLNFSAVSVVDLFAPKKR